MAKERRTTKGAIFQIDVAGGTSYTAVTLCRSIQLPPQTKARVDATALEDASAVSLPGIEEESEFSAELIWDPDDATDAALKTAYEADTLCGFRVDIVGATNTHERSWQGYITGLEPQDADGSNPALLQLTGIVKGAITDTITVT